MPSTPCHRFSQQILCVKNLQPPNCREARIECIHRRVQSARASWWPAAPCRPSQRRLLACASTRPTRPDECLAPPAASCGWIVLSSGQVQGSARTAARRVPHYFAVRDPSFHLEISCFAAVDGTAACRLPERRAPTRRGSPARRAIEQRLRNMRRRRWRFRASSAGSTAPGDPTPDQPSDPGMSSRAITRPRRQVQIHFVRPPIAQGIGELRAKIVRPCSCAPRSCSPRHGATP